ncbi:MAG: response regulator [Treponema sp.]|nr:response regulator [Treponema sp.]
MKYNLDDLKKYIFSSERNMNVVFFNILAVSGFIAAFVSMIIAMVAGIMILQNISIAVAEIIIVICFYIANWKNKVKLASLVLDCVITFIIFPVMFLNGGGIHSGMPIWYTAGLIYTFILVEGKTCAVILSLQILSSIGLFVFSYLHPEYVSKTSELDYLVDVIQSMTIIGIMLGSINRIQKAIYLNAIRIVKNQFEQLKASEKSAESANRAKSEFLSNMSHEIRTPTNAIIGMNEMILRESKDKKILEYAQAAQNSSRALLAIINDVLDISKIESGKLEIVPVEYKLSELISDCYGLVSGRLEKKGLVGSIYCEKNLPSGIRGDNTRMRQIIVNMLTNAVKYTEKGRVDFSISGTKIDEDIYKFYFSVKDTGMGIKAEGLDKIFKKFERLELTKNRNVEGTGLGLSISKQLAELMGGTIKVESEYGVGSEFTLIVTQTVWDHAPVGDVSFIRKKKQEYKIYHQSFEAPDVEVLAVDDVEMNLIVFENLLKETKMKFDFADSGAKCLEKAAEKKYDIIFMDHMMPEMDGIETLTRLHQMDTPNNDTPVIMLTANALSGVRDEYIKAGFNDYISKPLDGQSLEKMFLQYLPEGKVFIQNDESLPCGEKILKLRKFLPEFNYETALGFSDDDEQLCIAILCEYSSNNHLAELQDYFEECEWEKYRQILHSLKGTTGTVGLSSLAEQFRQQELLVKKCDLDTAKKQHQAMMDHYKNCITKMKESGLIISQE